MCKRMEVDEVMDTEKVEGIVKTAIAYSEENPERAYQQKGKWGIFYGISIMIAAIGLLLNHLYGQITFVVTVPRIGSFFRNRIVFTPKLAKCRNEDSFMLHLLNMTGCLYHITMVVSFLHVLQQSLLFEISMADR